MNRYKVVIVMGMLLVLTGCMSRGPRLEPKFYATTARTGWPSGDFTAGSKIRLVLHGYDGRVGTFYVTSPSYERMAYKETHNILTSRPGFQIPVELLPFARRSLYCMGRGRGSEGWPLEFYLRRRLLETGTW